MTFTLLISVFGFIRILVDWPGVIECFGTNCLPCSYEKCGCDLFVHGTQFCHMDAVQPRTVGFHDAEPETVEGLKFIRWPGRDEGRVNTQFGGITFHFLLAMDSIAIQNEPERFSIIINATKPSWSSARSVGGRPTGLGTSLL
jgi:hypothetical protein